VDHLPEFLCTETSEGLSPGEDSKGGVELLEVDFHLFEIEQTLDSVSQHFDFRLADMSRNNQDSWKYRTSIRESAVGADSSDRHVEFLALRKGMKGICEFSQLPAQT